MKPNLSATSEEPTLSTAAAVTKPKQQPSVDSDNDSALVGFVTVLTLAEPQADSEESPEENPAETKLNSEDWLLPSPGSALPESGLVWVNGEDSDHAVSLAEVTAADPSFEEKRKHILVACLRGESHFDYDGLSSLGVHCLKQLVIWLQISDRKQWNLDGAWLKEANLSGADLKGVSLRGAKLEDAKLEDADLSCADLSGADLEGAWLNYVNLKGANLEGAHMAGATLFEAGLTGVSLKSADLKGANLRRANLKGADLKGADLTRAWLMSADLQGADLTGAKLEGAFTGSVNLNGAKLEGVNVADLWGAKLEGADLTGAHMGNVPLTGAAESFLRSQVTNWASYRPDRL